MILKIAIKKPAQTSSNFWFCFLKRDHFRTLSVGLWLYDFTHTFAVFSLWFMKESKPNFGFYGNISKDGTCNIRSKVWNIFKLAVRLRTSEASKNRDYSSFLVVVFFLVHLSSNCFTGAFLSFLEICMYTYGEVFDEVFNKIFDEICFDEFFDEFF